MDIGGRAVDDGVGSHVAGVGLELGRSVQTRIIHFPNHPYLLVPRVSWRDRPCTLLRLFPFLQIPSMSTLGPHSRKPIFVDIGRFLTRCQGSSFVHLLFNLIELLLFHRSFEFVILKIFEVFVVFSLEFPLDFLVLQLVSDILLMLDNGHLRFQRCTQS